MPINEPKNVDLKVGTTYNVTEQAQDKDGNPIDGNLKTLTLEVQSASGEVGSVQDGDTSDDLSTFVTGTEVGATCTIRALATDESGTEYEAFANVTLVPDDHAGDTGFGVLVFTEVEA